MDFTITPSPGPHIADYVVIGIFLCICMGIWVYYGYQTDKQKTLENYFLGNRRLLLVPVSLSLFVTFISAISLMGLPTETYVYGIQGIEAGVGFFLSTVVATLTIVPLLHPLHLTSTFEYLQLRFRSKGVRILGTLIGMLQTLGYMGVALFAPALALQTVAGLPLWLSIAVIGAIGTIYTALGGIKSVVWTDVFQFIMIVVGLTAVTMKGISIMGKKHSIVRIATAGGRLQFFDFNPDPRVRHTAWGLWIGMTFAFFANWCNQSSIQRVSSVRTVREAKIAFMMLGPMAIAYHAFLGFLGIVLYSYYHVLECDPVQAGYLTNVNQMMPFFVLDVLRSLPGLPGVYISCLFSGALSTLSSGINALAANTVEDILGDWLKKSKKISQTFASKIFVFSYGLICVGLAYGIKFMSGSIVQMGISVFGACGGPLSGLYFLGALNPKANWIGAMAGSISALAFNMWMTIGSQIYGKEPVKLAPNPTNGCYSFNNTYFDNITGDYNHSSSVADFGTTVEGTSFIGTENSFIVYNISYTWYGMIGFILTLLIGTIISCLTGCDRGVPVEGRLLFPFCRKLYRVGSKYTYNVHAMEQKNILPPENFDRPKSPSFYFKPEEDTL